MRPLRYFGPDHSQLSRRVIAHLYSMCCSIHNQCNSHIFWEWHGQTFCPTQMLVPWYHNETSHMIIIYGGGIFFSCEQNFKVYDKWWAQIIWSQQISLNNQNNQRCFVDLTSLIQLIKWLWEQYLLDWHSNQVNSIHLSLKKDASPSFWCVLFFKFPYFPWPGGFYFLILGCPGFPRYCGNSVSIACCK